MDRISTRQLVSMIILFEIGSSPLFLLAGEAKNDAWLAVLLAMLGGGAILLFCNIPIQLQEPDKNLVEISRLYLGRTLGFLVSLSFTVYFLYASMRNVREFSDLTVMYLLPGTPLGLIMLILVITSAYAAYKGVEVFFRVAEFLLPLVMLIYFLMFLTFVVTGLFRLERLEPVLQRGWKPVVAAGIPEVISFPFGEISVFLMYWRYLDQKSGLRGASMAAYGSAGLFILLSTVMLIAVLGPLAGVGGVPMMMAASLVQISKIVERMDPLVVVLLYTGVLIKQTVYFFGAVLAISTMSRIPYKRLILPVGLVLYVISFGYRSLMQHVWIGFQYNVKYHFPIFTIFLPVVLVLVMKWRGRRGQPE